jgi:hypothetical protein
MRKRVEKDIMENKRQELRYSGIIELWVNDSIYAVRQFRGKKNRSSIINGWLQTLGKPLEPRTIYIILKPMQI